MKLLAGVVASTSMLPSLVNGHGFMFEPPTRNYQAHIDGLVWGQQPGLPMREYCHHCLNANNGVCGVAQSGTDFDAWLDSEHQPIPWQTLRTYVSGDVIEVHSHLASNHAGHMELKGCPDGKQSTQECLDKHLFEFVEDMAYGMPKDLTYTERGYYWGGQQQNGVDYAMKFRIPETLVGREVLLQWNYITANSCSPPGYADYFGGKNSQEKVLPGAYWTAGLEACVPPYPQDGSRSGVWPEHFFNCAEVEILGDADYGPPQLEPAPSSEPTQPPPTASPEPAPAPESQPVGSPSDACCSQDFKSCADWCSGSKDTCENCPGGNMVWLEEGPLSPDDTCLTRWVTCTSNMTDCCPGLICRGDQYYMQCQHPLDGGIETEPDREDSPPAEDDGEICGDDWASCIDDPNFCCEGLYCDLSTVQDHYAHCRSV